MGMRVIDIETTGTEPASARIVEIASVDLMPDGSIRNPQESYVNPGLPIPPESSAVHHNIDADVAAAPKLDEAISRFTGMDFYVAHNASFERSFLEAHLPGKWLCTYRIALRVWPDAPGHSNQVLRYWRGHVNPAGHARNSISPHRALSDCIVTACLMADILSSDVATVDQLLEWSALPPLPTVIGFGKHRGLRYDAVPRDYLEWMLKSDMSEEQKYAARYWLDRRVAG